MSTISRFVANRYLRTPGPSHHTIEQRVEWMYAFDVHCNSYFPFFLWTTVFQYFLLPLLLRPGILGRFLSNGIHVVAVFQYCYVSFLGFNVLPFLHNTQYWLAPAAVFALVMLLLTLFTSLNLTRLLLSITFG
eukprot:GAFH01004474.1.p1 GENE.GAFH01004474.1~~GAFH01004474.1.p1  ORF type:complete len:133 (+),score=24.99 GAFH01004474.1:337-735(+)